MLRKLIIITGGNLDRDFTCDFINNNKDSFIIAADKGLEFLYNEKIKPDVILGDFDSVDKSIIDYYSNDGTTSIHVYPCEKDDTDTQLAIKKGVDYVLSHNKEFDEIVVLGASGNRIDHLLGNIHGLTYAYDRQIKCCLLDNYNKIYLVPEKYSIKKNEQYGNYISFFAIDGDISISLKGFKYSLNNYVLSIQHSLAISNEIIKDEAEIIHDKGYLLGIETHD